MFEIVTLWEANTPLTNVAVVPLPADNVPVDVISAVLAPPSKAVIVLLLASSAVIWMLKAMLTVCVPMAPPPCRRQAPIEFALDQAGVFEQPDDLAPDDLVEQVLA